MKTGLRSWAHAVFAACLVASGVACGSSDSGGTGANSGGVKDCRGEDSSCNQTEVQNYESCLTTKCDSAFKDCYGSGYASGSYGGACGTYMGCIAKCGCNDTNCFNACGQPDATCTTCIQNEIAPCTQQCTAPACYGGSQNQQNGTCADLLTCCNSMTDANDKTTCLQEYDAVKSSDAACGYLYQTEKSNHKCN